MSTQTADTKHGVTPDEEVATRTGFEPVISAVTGQRVNRYTNGPLNPPRDENPRSNPEDFSGDVENRSLLIANSTGSDQAFASPERDGCDCPSWVIRCAHFGDRRVVLGHPRADRCSRVTTTYLTFATNVEAQKVCNQCGAADWWLFQVDGVEYHDFEADALDAFYAAEAELLGRDA